MRRKEKNRTTRETGGSNLGKIDGIQQMSGSNLERTKSRQQVTDQTVATVAQLTEGEATRKQQ